MSKFIPLKLLKLQNIEMKQITGGNPEAADVLAPILIRYGVKPPTLRYAVPPGPVLRYAVINIS